MAQAEIPYDEWFGGQRLVNPGKVEDAPTSPAADPNLVNEWRQGLPEAMRRPVANTVSGQHEAAGTTVNTHSVDHYMLEYRGQFNNLLYGNPLADSLPTLSSFFPDNSPNQFTLIKNFGDRLAVIFSGRYDPGIGVIQNLIRVNLDATTVYHAIKQRGERLGVDVEDTIYEKMKELLGLLKALQEFMRHLLTGDFLARDIAAGKSDAIKLEKFAKECAGDDMTRAINKLESIVSGVEAMKSQAPEVPKALST